MHPEVESFFDPSTGTFSYVVYSQTSSDCAIIDPVLDYDANSARVSHDRADEIIEFIRRRELSVQWLLETHIHADHLSASTYIRAELGGRIAASSAIRQVTEHFGNIFDFDESESDPSRYFDHLFEADEVFHIGELRVVAMHVPGHTQADMAYYVEDTMVFVGDTLFAPDLGTGRCDFPGGSASQLWQSIQRLLSLPDTTRIYVCHDYPPQGRDATCEFTIEQQRASNVDVTQYQNEVQFVQFRETRDKQLRLPTLLVPSLQANLRAGALPAAEENGIAYIKVPLNTL